MERRLAKSVAVTVAAALAATALSGCFDGTVRTPTEASRIPHHGTPARSAGNQKPESVDKRNAEATPASAAISIAAVGDTMLGNTPELPPESATYLDPVKGELKGDVVFGNLEGTLTEVGESPKCQGAKPGQCYAFRAPPEYATYLADAGFTLMSNANNHSYDFGEAGEDETIEALHSAGIEQTGLPGEITVVRSGGRRIAFVGFAPTRTPPR